MAEPSVINSSGNTDWKNNSQRVSLTCNAVRLIWHLGWVKICFKFSYEEIEVHKSHLLDPENEKKIQTKGLRVHIELYPVKLAVTQTYQQQIKQPIIFTGFFRVTNLSYLLENPDLLKTMDF